MPSYRKQLQLPAWYLLGPEGRITATIRAESRTEARRKFQRYGFRGGKVVSERKYHAQED